LIAYAFLQNGQNLITLLESTYFENRFPRRMQKHVRAVVSLVLKSGREKMNTHDVNGAHGVVVSHPLSTREALGSIPSVSIFPRVTGFILFSRPS
jgi:hypothetical protein